MFIPHSPEKLLDMLRDTAVIVEGKRDQKALKEFEIDNIFMISGESIEEFTEKLDSDYNYVVLTDFDEEGEMKNKKICKILEKFKLKFNPKLRCLVKDFFGITKIEELIKFSKLKEDVYHGEISAINYKIFNRSRFYRKWCSRKTRCDWSNIWSD
jgi:5S rRNA maturation endonuclease (ribonuclease M5)